MTSLQAVLRIVALLILLVVFAEYLLLDVLMTPPLVVAVTLFALSAIASTYPRAVAVISLILSILVPTGAVLGYLSGQLVILIPIFDVLVFGWLAWTAVQTLRSRQHHDAG